MQKIFNNEFLDWFVGFLEGDGCFSMSQRKNRQSPEYSLSINQKDQQVLEYIQQQFGFGVVYLQKNGYYRLVFQRQDILLQLVAICSERIKLPTEKYKFEKWACFFLNHLTKTGNLPAPGDPLYNQISSLIHDPNKFPSTFSQYQATRTITPASLDLTTAWLSGFMQAEGCFLSQFQYRSQRNYQILLRVSFRQNYAFHTFQQWTSQLGGYLQQEGNSTLVVFSSSHAIMVFRNYFTRFPLQGRKRIAQNRWMRVLALREKRLPLPPVGSAKYQQFVRIIESVNECQRF